MNEYICSRDALCFMMMNGKQTESLWAGLAIPTQPESQRFIHSCWGRGERDASLISTTQESSLNASMVTIYNVHVFRPHDHLLNKISNPYGADTQELFLGHGQREAIW